MKVLSKIHKTLRNKKKGVPLEENHDFSGFRIIEDKYFNYEQLQIALRKAGLESSDLIIGIDYTKSNTWTGTETFSGNCLHSLSPYVTNPYQDVIRILGKTLEVFDDDHMIPTFGFGDKRTKNKSVFPFYENKDCFTFGEVLKRYNEITPSVVLSGPTNFAPLIEAAIEIVRREKTYHILVIIADGLVVNVEETTKAIVKASKYALSIIMVGVGDGPFDQMEEFDDGIPERRFDNFQFVPFSEVTHQGSDSVTSELNFAVAALQEIPDQFRMIQQLGYIQS